MTNDLDFFQSEIEPEARRAAGRTGRYDRRIEFDLMRSQRRLRVEYRRFIDGKVALIGFVEEELDSLDDVVEFGGKLEEFVRCDAAAIPDHRLRRIAKLAIEKALECR